MLCVESYWNHTTTQLGLIGRIWKDLDDEHQQIQIRMFQVLISKLTNIITKFEKLQKREHHNHTSGSQVTSINGWRYVFIKEGPDESIVELAMWQKIFDPSWFLILKISDPSIERELSRSKLTDPSLPPAHSFRDALREKPLEIVSVFLPKAGLDTAEIRRCAGSLSYLQNACREPARTRGS